MLRPSREFDAPELIDMILSREIARDPEANASVTMSHGSPKAGNGRVYTIRVRLGEGFYEYRYKRFRAYTADEAIEKANKLLDGWKTGTVEFMDPTFGIAD